MRGLFGSLGSLLFPVEAPRVPRFSVFAADAGSKLCPSPLSSASILKGSVSTRGFMLVVRMSEEDPQQQQQQQLWDSRFTSGSFGT